ncbi:MAG: polyphosphate:AMP phosphotransferase [Acidaminococcaceae bacterium]
MLEKIDLKQSIAKEGYEVLFTEYANKLGALQREITEAKIPVIVLLEGWRGSLRGTLLNTLLSTMDPRGFRVYSASKMQESAQEYPFFASFWKQLCPCGAFSFYHRSWYFLKLEHVAGDKKEKGDWFNVPYEHINAYEKQLTAGGYVIIKLFAHVSKKKQESNLEKMNKIYGKDWQSMKPGAVEGDDYHNYLQAYEEMFVATDTTNAPWHVLAAEDLRYAQIEIFKILIASLENALANQKIQQAEPELVVKPVIPNILQQYQPEQEVDKKEYGNKLKEYQKKLQVMQFELYKRKLATVLGFEGWDAGGKGGAIRRVTAALDPLGYAVNTVAAPNLVEKQFHYLWRFWHNVPPNGEIAIFDRTWYGRVLVERVEGFAKPEEWRRAYQEINETEAQWAKQGIIIFKFWMQISKEEQYARFKARENDPDKIWKITEEDWRNREKWAAYEEAVNEMLFRTDTKYAPWTVVEANSKYYSRLKVLKTMVDRLEEILK